MIDLVLGPDRGVPAQGARERAWALIFVATADRRLADDWCDELAAELLVRWHGGELRLAAEDVLAWLHTSPPPVMPARRRARGRAPAVS